MLEQYGYAVLSLAEYARTLMLRKRAPWSKGDDQGTLSRCQARPEILLSCTIENCERAASGWKILT